MNLYILILLIMCITVVSVVGVRSLHHFLNKNNDCDLTDSKKWDVEEFTSK